ncbi:unnamed protein product, partial [Ectocarpus fasciculatus]
GVERGRSGAEEGHEAGGSEGQGPPPSAPAPSPLPSAAPCTALPGAGVGGRRTQPQAHGGGGHFPREPGRIGVRVGGDRAGDGKRRSPGDDTTAPAGGQRRKWRRRGNPGVFGVTSRGAPEHRGQFRGWVGGRAEPG